MKIKVGINQQASTFVGCVIVAFAVGVLAPFSCNPHNNVVQQAGQQQTDGTPEEYHSRCLGGHLYYETPTKMALQVDDYGGPVECEGGCADYIARTLEANPVAPIDPEY